MLTFHDYGVEFGPPNFSAEIHGNESKPLVSIYAEAVVNAANLESFKPGLREALWKRPAANDSERMDEDGAVHDLVSRFPTAKSVAFEDKFPGYDLVVHKSELFDERRDWPDVTVGNISVKPENGGSARIKFRIQARGEGLEWWVQMMNRAASITLTPPKAERLPSNHPDAPDDSDPLAGSLEFGRDAHREDDAGNDDIAHGSGNNGAISGDGSGDRLPEGVTARTVEGLAEVDRDIAETRQRHSGPGGKKRNGKASEAATVQ